MSMLMIVKAMNTRVGNPLRKLVLIKLCDNANDHGECWPSHQHIADQCEISKSSVKNHIKKLSEMGFLSIEHREGPKGNSSNMYQISLNSVAGDNPGGAGDNPVGGAGDNPRTSHSIEPVKEPVKEPKEKLDWSATQMSDEQISEIKKLRRSAKAPITQRVINQLAIQFELSRKRGFSNDDILNEWSVKGWRSYKDEWMKGTPTNQDQQPVSQQSFDRQAQQDKEMQELWEAFK